MKKYLVLVLCFMALAILVACGDQSSLPNKHEGSFFTIGYPDGFETLGRDTGVTITKDNQAIMVDAIEKFDSQKDRIESIDDFIEEITADAKNTTREVRNVNESIGVWIEGKNGGTSQMLFVVPLDGWCVLVLNNGATDEQMENEHRLIVESLEITDFHFDGFNPENYIDENDDQTTPPEPETDSQSDAEQPNTDEQAPQDTYEDTQTEEPDTTESIEIIELESSGNSLSLDEVYEGRFFRINVPTDASIANLGSGDSESISILIDDFQIIISASSEEQELNTEVSSGTIELESGTLRYGLYIVEIDGHKANFLESVAEDTMSVSFVIPLDGWTITISGYASGEAEYVNSMFDTIKAMVSTFVITDKNHMN